MTTTMKLKQGTIEFQDKFEVIIDKTVTKFGTGAKSRLPKRIPRTKGLPTHTQQVTPKDMGTGEGLPHTGRSARDVPVEDFEGAIHL